MMTKDAEPCQEFISPRDGLYAAYCNRCGYATLAHDGKRTMTDLSHAQKLALAAWWEWRRPELGPKAGYDPHALQEPKGTLLALQRRGLIKSVRRSYPGPSWQAEVTEEGRKVAEQCAIEMHEELHGP